MNVARSFPAPVAKPLFVAAGSLLVFVLFTLGWATLAPMTTSLQLRGHIVSSGESFEIQTPYGGQIAALLVGKHASVQKEDVLLRLDTKVEARKYAALKVMQRRLWQENAIISAVLSGHSDRVAPSQHLFGAQHLARAEQARAQIMLRKASARNLALQITEVEDKIALLEAQKGQMQERSERNISLVKQGLTTQVLAETLEEQILLVKAEIAGERAQRIALQDQALQAQRQTKLVALSLTEELLDARAANLRQLEDLATQVAALGDVLDHADVRAPIDGRVTEVFFEAGGMYAGRGQSLLTLAQPLAHPHLEFEVPPEMIDQLRPGMVGRLIIPGLSQRNLPPVRIEIVALSPRLSRAAENDSPAYKGKAEIAQPSLSALKKSLGDELHLRADMPVQLLIEGRSTTLANYLVAPFLGAFHRALQD